MIPNHLRDEYNKLSDNQKIKFGELLAWSSASGLPGIALPTQTYENILEMVKKMGPMPDTPVEPDRTVNHDWDIISKQGKDS